MTSYTACINYATPAMRVEINRTNPDGRINTLSPGATKTEGLLAAAGSDPAQLEGFLGYLAS